MSLQRRLTLFFVVIVILPLAVAGFVVQRIVTGEIEERAELSLAPALNSVVVAFNERADVVDERVRDAIEPPRLARAIDSPVRLDSLLQGSLDRAGALDFLLFVTPKGAVRASATTTPRFVREIPAPRPEEIVAGSDVGLGFVKTTLPVTDTKDRTIGSIVGGFWVDEDLLVGIAGEDVELSIVADGTIISSTVLLPGAVDVGVAYTGTFETEIGEEVTAQARELGPRLAVVSSVPARKAGSLSAGVLTSILGLLVLALIGTGALAVLLARLITQPLEEVSQAAQDVSQGRFDRRIPVRSRDEVGRLAVAFNEMTDRLADTIGELQSSRDALQRSVRRVGETLRSTHDMRQMLESILNTASDAVSADGAVLWMFTPTRDGLYAALSSGIDAKELGRPGVGEGVVGFVAERASVVVLPGDDSAPRPSSKEPRSKHAIGLPLYSHDRIMAVLVVYRSEDSGAFARSDVETLQFLAEQGGVAIENVLLHEEAQRLSLTDGLTGIYNRRYFQMQFRQLLATAVRFERPFSILMLDLDHFKKVNDTHGHSRGDAVLVEFSRRVTGALREVDTFARYGGEEFICLLSETGIDGAMTTAEKILDAVRSDLFESVGEEPVSLTVSIGVASFPRHGGSYKEMIEAADRALYRAKAEGRDRACTPEEPNGPTLKLAN